VRAGLTIEEEKPGTTKDTKDHEGLHFIGLPSCNFVSFLVKCRPIQLGRTSKAAAKTSAALVDFQRNG
jgi:hypothetical protein